MVRAFALALLMATSLGMWSCDGATAPSSYCPNPPYNWDPTVSRCRASDGQFAVNACCAR
jgi:hypothetical protein